MTATEHVTGNTPDITVYCLFDWYQYVYYHTPMADFPYQKCQLGCLLGVADNCMDELAYVFLPKSGKLVTQKSVWVVPPDALGSDSVKAEMLELDAAIERCFGDATLKNYDPKTMSGLEELTEPPPDLFEGDEDDPITFSEPDEKNVDADEYTPESMDEYLSAELLMPHGDGMQCARVIQCHCDDDGKPLGLRHLNPILDSCLYEIEFPDGSTDVVAANLIAENLYSQIDNEGHSHTIMKEIVDHQKSVWAVPKKDGYHVSHSGFKTPKYTTAGWELQVEWRDGSASWVPLKDLKVSNPVELAEYAVTNKIDTEPAFNWWVQKVLWKREWIIKKVKSQYWKCTHKYGIELPHSVEEALAIDEQMGTTFWHDAIE